MILENSKGNILLIDNYSGNNLLLENILDMEGYSVTTCLNPDEAIDMIRTIKPALIFLDIMVPGLKGFNVLDEVKNTDDVRGIPVIMVSARSEAVDLKKAKRLGAIDFIIKPIDIRTILRKVEHSL